MYELKICRSQTLVTIYFYEFLFTAEKNTKRNCFIYFSKRKKNLYVKTFTYLKDKQHSINIWYDINKIIPIKHNLAFYKMKFNLQSKYPNYSNGVKYFLPSFFFWIIFNFAVEKKICRILDRFFAVSEMIFTS